MAVGDQIGQTATRQLDALQHMGSALSAALAVPVSELWTMHNGYAACTKAGLRAITDLLDGARTNLTTDEVAALDNISEWTPADM